MGAVRSHRRRRCWAAGSPILLGGGAAMVTALGTVTIAYLTQAPAAAPAAQSSINPILIWSLVVGAVVGFIALWFQWSAEYRKLTYNPAWALKFMEIFDSPGMKSKRASAAREIKASGGKLYLSTVSTTDLDDVLNFFEDLGFYLHGDQLTPEVAHHAFHHWVRGYYSAAREYIEIEKSKERTNWEYIRYLFDASNEIETERTKDIPRILLYEADLTEFLDSEITSVAESGG